MAAPPLLYNTMRFCRIDPLTRVVLGAARGFGKREPHVSRPSSAAAILSAFLTSLRVFAPSASSRLAGSCDRLFSGILTEGENAFSPLSRTGARTCATGSASAGLLSINEHWQSHWHPIACVPLAPHVCMCATGSASAGPLSINKHWQSQWHPIDTRFGPRLHWAAEAARCAATRLTARGSARRTEGQNSPGKWTKCRGAVSDQQSAISNQRSAVSTTLCAWIRAVTRFVTPERRWSVTSRFSSYGVGY